MLLFDFLNVKEFFTKFLILLVVGVYKLVGAVYRVFLILAKANLFSQNDYRILADRIYVILGVAILFVVAYNFLVMIVDPDKDKSGTNVSKMLKDTIISFILIVLTPTLFSFAFDFQNSIIDQGTITKLFSKSEIEDETDPDVMTINNGGYQMAVITFRSFFYPIDSNGEMIADEAAPSASSTHNNTTITEATKLARESGNYSKFRDLAEEVVEDRMEFHWIIAILAGGYLIYVLLNFVFDLALRVVKLAFYQIMAPICIGARIIPKGESVFNNWWKAVSKTYLSLFARIFVMNLCIYLIAIFINNNVIDTVCTPQANCGTFTTLVAKALVVLGIITFMRQSAKLIDEIFGLGDTGSLGLRQRLKDSGAYAIGSTALAGSSALSRNAVAAGMNIWKKDQYGRSKWNQAGIGGKAKMLVGGVGSTIAGGASGSVRGFMGGTKAGSLAEMRKSASDASRAATDKRDARKSYKAAHGGTIRGAMRGHLSDTVITARDYFTDETIEGLTAESRAMLELEQSIKSQETVIEDALESQLKKGSKSAFKFETGGFNIFAKDKDGQLIRDRDGNTIDLYEKLEKEYANYKNAESKFNAGIISQEQFQKARSSYMGARDDARDALKTMAFAGDQSDDYRNANAKGRAQLAEFFQSSENIKTVIMKNAASEPVQQALGEQKVTYVDSHGRSREGNVLDVIVNGGQMKAEYLEPKVNVLDDHGNVVYERNDRGEIIVDDHGNPVPQKVKAKLADLAKEAKSSADARIAQKQTEQAAKGDDKK